jgi:hypothetical protein
MVALLDSEYTLQQKYRSHINRLVPAKPAKKKSEMLLIM